MSKNLKHLEETVPPAINDAGHFAEQLQRGIGADTIEQAAQLAQSAAELAAVLARSEHERAIDGKLVGADGVFDCGTPLAEVHGIKPSDHGHADIDARIVYINGIWNDETIQRETMQRIADATGAEVIGLHNSTGASKSEDVLQCIGDKLDIGNNAAVESMAHLIVEAVRSGEPLNVIAHSQGGLCTSRAVDHAIRELRESGMDADSIKDGLTNVHIQTFGGAAIEFPDGPQYFHHINTNDPVPVLFGYRELSDDVPKQHHGWDRDTTATLEAFQIPGGNVSLQHSIDQTYIPHINMEMIQSHNVQEVVGGAVLYAEPQSPAPLPEPPPVDQTDHLRPAHEPDPVHHVPMAPPALAPELPDAWRGQEPSHWVPEPTTQPWETGPWAAEPQPWERIEPMRDFDPQWSGGSGRDFDRSSHWEPFANDRGPGWNSWNDNNDGSSAWGDNGSSFNSGAGGFDNRD